MNIYKNYYKILKISSSANDDQIKQAYRLLAKKYHPDINKDGTKVTVQLNLSFEWLEKNHIQVKEKTVRSNHIKDLTGYQKYYRIIDKTNTIIIPYNKIIDEGIVINCMLGFKEFRIILEKNTVLPKTLKLTNVNDLIITIKGDGIHEYSNKR